jgi:hypothetical protein
LFNIYVDDVTDLRSTSDYDCNVGRAFYGCIMYAYDLLILSPSVGRLQHLLSCGYEFGNEQHINSNKSAARKYGGIKENISCMLDTRRYMS